MAVPSNEERAKTKTIVCMPINSVWNSKELQMNEKSYSLFHYIE